MGGGRVSAQRAEVLAWMQATGQGAAAAAEHFGLSQGTIRSWVSRQKQADEVGNLKVHRGPAKRLGELVQRLPGARGAVRRELVNDLTAAELIQALAEARLTDPAACAGELAELADLDAHLAQLVEQAVAALTGEPPAADDSRPEIPICVDTTAGVDAAIGALTSQGIVFERGGSIVEVITDPRAVVPGIDSTVRVADVGQFRLAELIGKAGRCVRRVPVKVGDKTVFQPQVIKPPRDLVATLLERNVWPFRPLVGVSETPTIRRDGTLLTSSGYDAVSGYWMSIRPGSVVVPEHFGMDDADAALDRLRDLFCDFPFETPAHLSGALALILTLVARPAIPGPVPLFLTTASTAGSGKTLAIEVAYAVATGRRLKVSSYPDREEEAEKRITAILRTGASLACFDNVDGMFGGASLDALITATTWLGRELGASMMLHLPARTVWCASGNNVRWRGDMARRGVVIRIEPDMEDPHKRTGFKYPRLVDHVIQNRAALLGDCLCVLGSYVRAKMPVDPPGYGSFEDWNRLVRGCLIWLGEADLNEATEAMREESDDVRGQMVALAHAWWGAFGPAEILLSELAGRLEGTDRAVLKDAVKAICFKAGVIDTSMLGNRLRRQARRIFGGYRFVASDTRTHGVRAWKVQKVEGT